VVDVDFVDDFLAGIFDNYNSRINFK
jgi:hypothetical protein